jgi:hypothetical protein
MAQWQCWLRRPATIVIIDAGARASFEAPV